MLEKKYSDNKYGETKYSEARKICIQNFATFEKNILSQLVGKINNLFCLKHEKNFHEKNILTRRKNQGPPPFQVKLSVPKNVKFHF